MMPWLAFLVTLSLLILVHELGHFLVARWIGVNVERFSLGFGPTLFKVTSRGTEYVLSLLPFGGYVKMAGEAQEPGPGKPWEFRGRSIGERAGIVLAGPLINYLLGFVLFVSIFTIGAPTLSTEIGKVLEGFPAAEAGLKAEDRILSINGKQVETWEEVTRAIHAQRDWITLVIQRQEETLTLGVQPKVQEATNLLGAKIQVGMVGIVPAQRLITRRYPVPRALVEGAKRVWFLTHMTLQAVWRIATGGLSLRESVTGPIGIFYLTSAVAEQGLLSLLQLIAVLSTSLGLFNLLPIPVLDGGHLAFLLAETFKGSPVSLRAQEMMTRVGLALLGLLLLVVTYNDLATFKVLDKLSSFF